MLITALKPTKNRRRLSLFLDGQFAFSLSPDLVLTHSLSIDQNLAQAQVDQLLQEAFFEKLYAKALNFLSFRPRSQKETQLYLQKALKKLGSSSASNASLISQILTKLHRQKLLNDRQFASWWIKQRITHRPKGNLALKSELIQKGISRSLIDSVLPDSDQEKLLAKQVLQSKRTTLQSLSPSPAKLKAQQYLRTRGFTSPTVYSVIDEFIQSE